MKAIEAYDSAYPGSMHQREDGSFIRREDAEALQDALNEANKDAARYRWLRENRDVLLLTGFFGNGCINRTISEVDAAIDAAMKTPNAALTGAEGVRVEGTVMQHTED